MANLPKDPEPMILMGSRSKYSPFDFYIEYEEWAIK